MRRFCRILVRATAAKHSMLVIALLNSGPLRSTFHLGGMSCRRATRPAGISRSSGSRQDPDTSRMYAYNAHEPSVSGFRRQNTQVPFYPRSCLVHLTELACLC
ncbi:hypothetical protein CPAR01_16580 [Colletotrichum paranaense]|uniref:Secreted protein n=1 Tax=Colletotrichum paranaense TaxID=1914294 RepID=A0ABQ9RVV2_9PEZI|nr:uncharacterized protein CPAR01_16580 [Colletotrichum paranaense]KAK1516057.1 hypothetical protein CPAR01_16580 [Colletotrichum paranaense]